jgi:hypothetical protein
MPITTFGEAEQAITALQTTIQSLMRKDVGTIILSANEVPPPDCVRCDGRMYDMTDVNNRHLADLFAVIGRTFGGDGVQTFMVPELRGEFVRIWDDGMRGDGPVDAPRAFGSAQDWTTGMSRDVFVTLADGNHDHGGSTGGQSRNHTHSASASGDSAQGGKNTFGDGEERGVNGRVTVTIGEASVEHTHGIAASGTHSHAIAGGDHETRPRNVALAAYIRF